MSNDWEPSGAHERAYPPTPPAGGYPSPDAYPPPPPPPPPEPPPARKRWPWIAGGLVVVVLLVVAGIVGASGDDDTATDRPDSTVTPPGADTTQADDTTTTAEPAGETAGGVPEAARAYFEAFVTQDLSRMGAMLDASVESSPAALYATHQIAFIRATQAFGPYPATTEVGDDAITVHSSSIDANGNEVKESTVYGAFTLEGDRLTGFSVDQVPVADRIRAGDPAGGSAEGVTARIVTAYHTARGDLALNVDIANGRGDVVEVADYEWSLTTPDGRQVSPVQGVAQPPSVQPGATAGHVAVFEQVGLGGTLRFVAFSADFTTEIRFDVAVPA